MDALTKNIIELLDGALDSIYPAMNGTKALPDEEQDILIRKAHMKIEIAKTNIEEALVLIKTAKGE